MSDLFLSMSKQLIFYESQNGRKAAIIYALFSQILFVTMFSFVGLLRIGYSTFEIVTYRMAIGFTLNYLYCYFQGIPIFPTSSFLLKMMAARGLIGSIGMLLIFQSFKNLNLSDAVILSNMMPVWTCFLSAIFLNEKLTVKSVTCCIVSFVGTILIVRPGFIFGEGPQIEGRNQFLGGVLGVLGSMCSSIVVVLISKLQKNLKINNSQLLIYGHFCTSLVSGIGQITSPNNDFILSSSFVIIILIISLCGFGGQMLFSRSFTLEKASVISQLSYSGVILSYIIDIFIFNEELQILSILGSLLIVTGSVFLLM